MEDLGLRMVGAIQMHLSSNQAWCTALLIHLPPQHTVSFIQNYPRSLTVPHFRPTVFATVLLIVQRAILPLTFTFLPRTLFVPYY